MIANGYGGMLPAFATITMHTCFRADRAANTLAHISGDTMRSVTSLTSAAILAAALFLTAGTAIAEDAAKPVDPDAKTGDPAMDALLAKEKEARKSCKIDICSILRGKKAEGADPSCHVVQTWPKPALDAMLAKTHVSWPYSTVHCQTDIKLKRATLVAAMTQAKYEAAFDSHTLDCEIERGAGIDKYTFKVAMAPKVTFENGKATAAQLQWGDIEAPLVAKAVIYPITGLDNQTGVLSGQFISMVNRFVDAKCDEVKADLKLN